MTQPFIMLAPMDGVVDAVTRALYSAIGGYDRFVTEFVRVTDRLVPEAVFYRNCPELKTGGRTAEGVPVYVQLLGGRPEILAENAAFAVRLGAPGIDLNFGCPAPTVNRHDGGATLLKNPSRLFDVIRAIRKVLPAETPVSAKVRLGFSDKSLILEIGRAVDEAGASMLIVHARTRDEGYKPPAHWEYIARIKETIKVPVVANGDIWSLEDYKKCREISGCEHVALGRGAIAAPDLSLRIRAYLADRKHGHYDWNYIQHSMLPRFIEALVAYRGAHYGVARTKQWLRLLVREYPEAAQIFEQIKRAKSPQDIYQVITDPA